MLNPKQLRFCQEYVSDLNGTKAAIRAGYSKRTAAEQAARLLTNVKVQEKIKELQAEVSKRTEITADMVVKELAKVGFANIKNYIETDNAIKDISTLSRKHAAAVESITTIITEFEGGTKTRKQFKLHDKISALEKLGRHLGIFEKDNNQKNIQIIVERVKRAG